MIAKKLTVVMYHYIRDQSDKRFPNLKSRTPDEFRDQLRLFKRDYQLVTPELCKQAFSSTDGASLLPGKPLLLTFDDGYEEHHSTVLPILKDFGATAVFFPITSTLSRKELLDLHKIHFVLATGTDPKDLVARTFTLLDHCRKEFKLPTNEALYEKLAKAFGYDNPDRVFLKRLIQRELPSFLRGILATQLFLEYVGMDDEDLAKTLYLSKKQVRELHAEGMEIGVHTHTHPWLDTLTKDEQRNEIETSKDILAKMGVLPANWIFAYPYGGLGDGTTEILKTAGCELALTTEPGEAAIDPSRRLCIARLDTNQFQ
jgi:peptidoglycan/xylan/chitin deacetylase (PgdA/CDA1 family)